MKYWVCWPFIGKGVDVWVGVAEGMAVAVLVGVGEAAIVAVGVAVGVGFVAGAQAARRHRATRIKMESDPGFFFIKFARSFSVTGFYPNLHEKCLDLILYNLTAFE